MIRREHTWELIVGAVSWCVAIGALALVGAFVVYNAVKTYRRKVQR